ncbi:MAG: hypothetical protein QF921_14965 [Pseudomonadales bacterium]|jgi:hypothetical protein|nr:hypothetical protein [Pseudomonadales bacterium]MDP6472942.1 hypothetical protein [Pseudomonadales bacterium]MDP6826302.1 hypothetical protein [Pseudomonadales bacterium]MDP6972782.1 hypothetical protein [Pseudomonadales bacterium]|tara:strand:- start:442 stop:651 length:210 start_codon:yes stop_codon:yes gene_type:complete
MLPERRRHPNHPRLIRVLITLWLVAGAACMASLARLGVVRILLAVFLSFAMLDERDELTAEEPDRSWID